MDRRLIETLKNNTQPLRGGEFIDAYYRTIRRDGICGTIYASVDKCGHVYVTESKMKTIRIGGLYDKQGEKHQSGSIYDPDGLAPPLDTCGGGEQTTSDNRI